MICCYINLDVDSLTNPVTSGNDTICVPIKEKFRICGVYKFPPTFRQPGEAVLL